MGRSRWRPSSISDQITLAMWLVFVPIMAITAAAVSTLSSQQLLNEQLAELRIEAMLLESKVSGWHQRINERLKGLRATNNFQNLNERQLTELLNQAIPRGSAAHLALINHNGQTLASTDTRSPGQGLNNNSNLKRAADETSNLSIDMRPHAGQEELHITLPLGPASLNQKDQGNDKTQAFLSYSIPVEAFTREAGIDSIEEVINLGKISGKSLDSKDRWISGLPSFAIAKTNGDLLLGFGPSGRLLPSKKLAQSAAWQKIASIIQKPCSSGTGNHQAACQAEISHQGDRYIINYQHTNTDWAIINTISKTIATRTAENLARNILGLEFLLLLIGTTLMRFTARRLADPIEEASRSITQLSTGNFDIDLSLKPTGEIGDLYDNIRTTSNRLKELVATEKIAAVSIEQMQTAKSIQKNFLPVQRTTTEQLAVAALCEPALEVGADWYDIIPIENGTVLVLADVCDKGVGSALFMSVFRSLVRFFVQQTMTSDLSPEQGQADTSGDKLSEVITRVNTYMVENHGSASMFATILLALHEPHKQQLAVINAGHESALLLAHKGQGLHKLAASGPAVGIFASAHYATQRVSFHPGDWLLLYSDGLPDAVNGNNRRFGHEHTEQTFLKAATKALEADGLSNCQEVLDEIDTTLKDFCGGSDAFDDLTILVATALHPVASARDSE
jgi:serine phosphatase RsbU (regulator of sigma subunit)